MLIFAYMWWLAFFLLGLVQAVASFSKHTKSTVVLGLATAVYLGLSAISYWASYTVLTHSGVFR